MSSLGGESRCGLPPGAAMSGSRWWHAAASDEHQLQWTWNVLSREYCDHQENRKSAIGRDHLYLKCTQRGYIASRWAEDSQWSVYHPTG
jgi:hypothetical protein